MENMKPREKLILALTIVALVAFAAFQFGLFGSSEEVTSSSASTGGDVAKQERLFKTNLRALEELYVVRYEYSRIGQVPSAENKDLPPHLAFQQEVFEISQKLGFQFPPIRPQAEDIDGIDEYQLLSVGIKTQGSFAETVNLLKSYESAGMIFREVELRPQRDRDVIDSTIVVARIAERAQRRTNSRPTR